LKQSAHLLNATHRVATSGGTVIQLGSGDSGHANVGAGRDAGETLDGLWVSAQHFDHGVRIEERIHRLGPGVAVREGGHSRMKVSMPGSSRQIPAKLSSQSRDEISTITGVSFGSASGESGTTTPSLTLPGMRVMG